MLRVTTLKDVRYEQKKLESDLKRYLNEKDFYFSKTQPQSPRLSEKVNGGEIENKTENYVISSEELDKNIYEVQKKLSILVTWEHEQLKALEEYDSYEYEVVKEYLDGTSVVAIAFERNVSEMSIYRILRKHFKKREIVTFMKN